MAYVDPDDLREGSGQWFARGLYLDDVDVPDAELEGAITAASGRIDLLTDDHFEPEPGGGPPEPTTTLDLAGSGGSILEVPKRIRSITQIDVRSPDGTLTPQDAANYRVIQSLVGGVRTEGDLDYVQVVRGKFLTSTQQAWPDESPWWWNNTSVWPTGPNTVRLTGTFSWPATPDRIKRAVALLVWDLFTDEGGDLRRTESFSTDDATYNLADRKPTGIPEVDEIVRDFTRAHGVAV